MKWRPAGQSRAANLAGPRVLGDAGNRKGGRGPQRNARRDPCRAEAEADGTAGGQAPLGDAPPPRCQAPCVLCVCVGAVATAPGLRRQDGRVARVGRPPVDDDRTASAPARAR